ncbi:Uncharacterised protein [Neisseria animaloris]|uniref:Uncharacterized protein n=1 Tax=Neisseria animaloris TaxID=326522 RepID=A0A3S5BQH2_9NEIS|nr:Uncharacterised protein [Neisseria animaloris]
MLIELMLLLIISRLITPHSVILVLRFGIRRLAGHFFYQFAYNPCFTFISHSVKLVGYLAVLFQDDRASA